MKKIIAIAAVVLLMGCSSTPTGVRTYNAEDLTAETLAAADTDIIVSVAHGVCLDAETGDGQAEDGYINYNNVAGVQTGDKVTTYFVYKSESSNDDILYRYDVIND